MLQSTFVHCSGVGPVTERRLWAAGARTWTDLLEGAAPDVLPLGTRRRLDDVAAESVRRLAAGDYAWFARALPSREHWRAIDEFSHGIAYLDIETTGQSTWDTTTVIGISKGGLLRQFVRNEGLREFRDVLDDATMLVTFSGTSFDLPVLRREFGVDFPQLHVDLCHLLRRLGYRGGLKAVEVELGLSRAPETAGMTGMDAVALWWRWHNRSDADARRKLLAYNAEDVCNMERLLDIGRRLIMERYCPGTGAQADRITAL